MADARTALQYLSRLKGKTLVTFQSLADLDAVASAYALKLLVPRLEIGAADSANSQVKKVFKALSLRQIEPFESLEDFENVIIVDANNAAVLGKRGQEIQDFPGKIIVIDHHLHSKKMKSDFAWLEPEKTSTCEMVYALLKEAKKKIDARTALLLAAGIISDTAVWKSANDDSFLAVGELLKLAGKGEKEYETVMKLVSSRPDVSHRKKRLDAAARAEVTQKGEVLVAVSTSEGFEMSCAAALVELGCDYAFVGNPKKGRVFGVKASNAPGNIGLIMEEAGEVLGGSGGGHENVGGAEGKAEKVRNALEKCRELALEECG